MNKDNLGDRIKTYEDCYRISIPSRSYVVVRVDGRAFHTFTKSCERPFDAGFLNFMHETTLELCQGMSNARFAYHQSDEISVLMCDFEKIETQPWFDNNLQKITSISASIATAKFNQLWSNHIVTKTIEQNKEIQKNSVGLAHFDARVFILPSRTEVLNYFLWRQNDAARNSVQMVARSMFSQKELHGLDTEQLKEKIFEKSGKQWIHWPTYQRLGTAFYLQKEAQNPDARAKWVKDMKISKFSSDWSWFSDKIPYNT